MTIPATKALMTNWPMLKKLAPIQGGRVNTRNLVYMAEIALLTRLAVGAARIYKSRPANQSDPNMTAQDKKKSFYERLFMEIIGTGSYVTFLHFGSDLFANLMEFSNRHKIPQLHQALQHKLSGYEYQKFDSVFSKMFNHNGVGMVDTVLNGKTSMVSHDISRPTLDYFKTHLGENLFKKVEQDLTPFIKKTANKSAVISILGGALLGAFVGGNVIQKFNDNALAPFLSRVMKSSGNNKNQTYYPAMGQANGLQTQNKTPQFSSVNGRNA